MRSRHGVQGSGWGWLAAKPSTGRLFLTTCPNQDALQVQHPVRPCLLCGSHWSNSRISAAPPHKTSFIGLSFRTGGGGGGGAQPMVTA